MPQKVEFLYDFASPNAYLVHRALPQFSAESGVEFTYSPALIGGIFKLTGNQPPMMAFSEIKNKLAYEQLEFERFMARYGITNFTFTPHFPVNTVMLMRGALLMENDARLMDYIEAGMVHIWEQSLDMGKREVFIEAMTASGFDGEALAEANDDPALKQALIERTQNAVNRGVFGIPTFFVGKEMFYGKERLAQVAEAAHAKEAA